MTGSRNISGIGRQLTTEKISSLQLFDVWYVDLQEGTQVKLPCAFRRIPISYTNTAAADSDHKISSAT